MSRLPIRKARLSTTEEKEKLATNFNHPKKLKTINSNLHYK